jgi:hypothetical protein
MGFLVIAVLIGLIPAAIAHNKGHSFAVWWLYGFLFFIVALPCALVMQPRPAELERRRMGEGGLRKCPHCAELIKADARVCRFCGRDLQVSPMASPSLLTAMPVDQRVDAYLAALDSPSPAEREAAAEALGDMGGEAAKAMTRLGHATSDPDLSVRTRAEWALGRIRRQSSRGDVRR